MVTISRWVVFLLISFIIAIMLSLLISPMLNDTGIFVVSGDTLVDPQTIELRDVYMDFDTGLILTQNRLQGIGHDTVMSRTPLWERHSNAEVYALVTDSQRLTTFIVSFDGLESVVRYYNEDFVPVAMYWYVVDESLLVVHKDDEDTVFSVMDIDRGNLTELRRIEFAAGFVQLSPDNRYLLLREYQEAVAFQQLEAMPMQVLDLESDFVRDLGSPALAYWSPDARYLALGYQSAVDDELDVRIYDFHADNYENTGLRVPRDYTPFFYDPLQESNVLWANDSQSLAIANQTLGLLYHYHIGGDVQSMEAGRFQAKLWSPDARYLIVEGYDSDDNLGGYILNFDEGSIHPIQSEQGLVDWNAHYAWSPNSRTIAVMMRVMRDVEVTVYDTHGQVVRDTMAIDERFRELSNLNRIQTVNEAWWGR